MEKVKVGGLEKAFVSSTYRTFQRLNPLTYYYEPIITDKIKECKDKNNIIIDGHWHDFFSDGDSSPRHMVDVAHRRGIDAGSGDNHNTTEHWDYYEEAEKRHKDFVYIPGIEVSTKQGDILAQFPSYDSKNHQCVKELTSGKKFCLEEVIDKIHEAGGIATVPHPNKFRGIGLRNLKKYKDKIDAVEEINIGAGEQNNLGKTIGLPSFGSSDSHSKINVGSGVSKIPKEYFKDCFSEDGIDKDKFRERYIDFVRNEKILINEARSSTIVPCSTVSSSLEENIEKTTYANPFLLWLRAVEYFLDKRKIVAKRLAACLEKE